MARKVGRLSPAGVAKAKMPGMLRMVPDSICTSAQRAAGRGSTASCWTARLGEMGLGPLHTIGLAEARQRALECRRQRLDGIDPLQARMDKRAGAKLEAARGVTFRACADLYIKAHRAGWKNAKHAAQWDATLQAYVYPSIGDLPASAIDTGLVTSILEAVWYTKPETASRVRGRVEQCSTSRRRMAGELARTRHDGAGILRMCCPGDRKFRRSSTMRRCRGVTWQHSWAPSNRKAASRRWRFDLRS